MLDLIAIAFATIPLWLFAGDGIRRRRSFTRFGVAVGMIGFWSHCLSLPLSWPSLSEEESVGWTTFILLGELFSAAIAGLAISNVVSRFEGYFLPNARNATHLLVLLVAALASCCALWLFVIDFDETLMGPSTPGFGLLAQGLTAVLTEEAVFRIGIPLLLVGGPAKASGWRFALALVVGSGFWLLAHVHRGFDGRAASWFATATLATVASYAVFRTKSVYGALGAHLGMNIGLFVFWWLLRWPDGYAP